MCLRKLFPGWYKPDPVTPEIPPNLGAKRKALLFGINDYGGANDLNGCLNDIDDVEKKLKAEFPDFVITKYKDALVTCQGFYDAVKSAILAMPEGGIFYGHYSGHGTQVPTDLEVNGYHEAFYFVDGPFLDDRFQELMSFILPGRKVIFKLDCCFSGDMLRDFQPGLTEKYITKNRFMPLPGQPIMRNVVGSISKAVTKNCLVISGCGENQTSADAFLNGRYNGAFTFFDNRSYNANTNYTAEVDETKKRLANNKFDQVPTIDGDVTLFNDLIFT